MELKRVFHFSGGPSSAYMVLHNYKPGDIVIFCDTGREDADTIRFVKDFSSNNHIPVVMLSGDWREDVIVKGHCIPNMFKRQCTIRMKIKRARRYIRTLGLVRYVQFIGFRYDEPERVKTYKPFWKKVITEFPLYDARVEQADINLFWEPIPYRLKIPAILKNCDLCFLKGEAAIMAIIQNDPSKADKWIDEEEDKSINPHGYTYHKGKTMRQIRDAALKLTKVYNLEEINPKYTCACTA
jgi:hypothetical protein